MKKHVLLTLFSILISACFSWTHGYAGDRIPVLVSVLPQKYFVERIGGDRVTVDVLVKPGKSPATYAPTPSQIKELVSSRLYFRVGVPFENGLMDKIISLTPETRIIDTRNGIPLRGMKEHHGHQGHADEDHDSRQGKDPHIWMNPLLVKIQVQTMFQALCDIDPQGKETYTGNLALLLKDLDALNSELTALLSPVKGENVFVFHPSFGYFTDAYGLHQIAIETMGKAPKGKELGAIILEIKKKQGRIIFVQPQFDTHAAQKMAQAVKGSVVPIDPLAYDYLENMISIGKAIAAGLAKN